MKAFKIEKFGGVGKYELLEYVSPNIWKTISVFEKDDEAIKYARENKVAILDPDSEKIKRIKADEYRYGNRQWE